MNEMTVDRSESSYLLMNGVIYAFFGYCYSKSEYIDTVECLDITKVNDTWKVVKYKTKGKNFLLKSSGILPINENEIFILGGFDGLKETSVEQLILFNMKEKFIEEVNKKLLQSRLDLLFARFNILTRAPNEAIEKLTSSIITYSEIYGPESVGLTPQYYYLADYFLDMGMGDDKKEKRRKIVVKNIYLKIADMWKMYFLGMVNPLFLSNDDQDLILAIGETYVKLIANRIGSTFRDSETELELKFKMIKVIILKRTNSDIYEKALENVLDLKKKIEDKIIDKEYIEEMAEEMKN